MQTNVTEAKKEVPARHEHKLIINMSDYLTITSRLKHVAYLDRNSLDTGGYQIRSMYFDDYNDKAVREKLSGLSRREKFRIRFYNDDPSYMSLERKRKANKLCYKEKCPITREECQKILDGDYAFMADSGHKLMVELYSKMAYQKLRPRNIIDYHREAYVYNAGNVRITFDQDIRSSNNIFAFLNEDLTTVPVAKYMIMEVKYDGFFPEVIRQAIQVGHRHETEFSKYVIGRLAH